MSILFDSIKLGPVTAKNRFVRSATGEWMAEEDGTIQERLIPMYEGLAEGGVGLIISGHLYVLKEWPCHPCQTGIWGDHHLEGLRRMVEVSRRNDTLVVAQINSAGRKPREMTVAEIHEVRGAFVSAAQRAVAAGFDGVQIHASHGYLLSRFLTPSENERTDGYGGDAAGRRRLLLEIAQLVKENIGPAMLLCCKLGAVDGRDNSLTIEETVETARQLESLGFHALELSTTLSGPTMKPIQQGIDSVEKEAYLLSQTVAVKDAVSIPVMQVGGMRTMSLMEGMVSQGKCDMISLCRPLLREPNLINRFQDGTVTRSACISCSKCSSPQGTRCIYS